MDGDISVVTALYDIGREQKGDGRQFSQYLAWFQKTLSLAAHMVVFIDESHASFVQKCRSQSKYGTKIMSEPFSKAPMYGELGRIRKILRRQWIYNKMLSMPEYQVIIHSKFGWLKRAIDENPFKSRVFIWLDAGYSRFMTDDDLKAKVWPHPSWTKKLLGSSRIWLQANAFRSLPDIVFRAAPVGWHMSCLMGGVICGNAKTLEPFCKTYQILVKRMLEKGKVDGEEVILSLFLVKDKKLFRILMNDTPVLGALMAKNINHAASKLKPEIGN